MFFRIVLDSHLRGNDSSWVFLRGHQNYLGNDVSSELLRGNRLLVLKDSYDQIDDQIVEVYSAELVKNVRTLREIKNKIKQLYQKIGQEKT